jgi:hypothetical protein
MRYVPAIWWANDLMIQEDIFEKIKLLVRDPAYRFSKFRSILEKIILPANFLKSITDNTIHRDEDKKFVLDWVTKRQNKLASIARDVDGFSEFMREHGARAFDELKRRFENFAQKREDLALPVSKILQTYDRKFTEFKRGFPNKLSIDVRPFDSQPVIQEYPPLSGMLKKMEELDTKPRQKDFFVAELANLKTQELLALSKYMQEIQKGKYVKHPFLLIRRERSRFFYNSGNTRTWASMFHAVKSHLISKLNQDYTDNSKIILEAETYDTYAKQLGHHTGRQYAQIGKTHSLRIFEERYIKAVKNETPTGYRYRIGTGKA